MQVETTQHRFIVTPETEEETHILEYILSAIMSFSKTKIKNDKKDAFDRLSHTIPRQQE